MSVETIDAEFQEHTGSALATRAAAPPAAWVPSFAVKVDEAVAMVEAKRDFFGRVMREGEHYGKIPGTGDKAKPALLKPGAELLLANMSLRIELSDADAPTIDYGEDAREGMVRYRRVCRVYRQTGPTVADREIIAQAEGSCSSRESKYRWRDTKRKCPECGAAAIIKGKADYGGGWLCFKKQNGCGAKFKDGDPAIEAQTTGRVPNPDLADVENTILKMADKRALVAAALLATGCSDIFTQDVEEIEHHDPDHAPRATDPDPAPARLTADDPGTLSDATLGKLTKAFAVLGLSGAEIGATFDAITDGRVNLADAIKYLSENEGRRLGKQLSQTTCDACGKKPLLEPHAASADGHPCPNDASPEAQAIRTKAASRERFALEADEEIPL